MASFWSNTAERQNLLGGEARRFLALSLPRWATDSLKRLDPALAASGKPVVLFEKLKGAMRIVELDDRASASGLFIGQSMSEARAICPVVEARAIDRPMLTARFADFADWHTYASPIVSVLDSAPYGDLVLDITGVSHLFGGEGRLLERVLARLRLLGFTVSGSIASTIGCAWALAHFSADCVLDAATTEAALAGLPVAALRLDEARISGLNQMGLKRIGQLYDRERKALQARFGIVLLQRLDQALGHSEERLTPRLPAAEQFVERRFAEPIGLVDDVLACTTDLSIKLASDLERRELGAQGFELFLYRVDHKVIHLGIRAGRPTRDAGHIARLFANRSERLGGEYDPGFGIDMIRLAATSISPLSPTQLGALDAEGAPESLDKLYDRIASRLGALSIVRSAIVDTHIPERATRFEPAVSGPPAPPPATGEKLPPRPLRLLPDPDPIIVLAQVPDGPPTSMTWRRVAYRFVKASGPERIEAEWWRRAEKLDLLYPPRIRPPREDDKGKIQLPPYNPDLPIFDAEGSVRDYYVAEDDGGRRFWLFRQGLYGAESGKPGWFLHGIFA